MHISVQRKADFLERFAKKVEELERLIREGSYDACPKPTPSAFIRWSRPEVGVTPISRDGFYKKAASHSKLRKRTKDALNALERKLASKQQPTRAATAVNLLKAEVAEALRHRKLAEALAVTTRAELRAALKRISALENQLARSPRAVGNVVRLSPVPRNKES